MDQTSNTSVATRPRATSWTPARHQGQHHRREHHLGTAHLADQNPRTWTPNTDHSGPQRDTKNHRRDRHHRRDHRRDLGTAHLAENIQGPGHPTQTPSETPRTLQTRACLAQAGVRHQGPTIAETSHRREQPDHLVMEHSAPCGQQSKDLSSQHRPHGPTAPTSRGADPAPGIFHHSPHNMEAPPKELQY